MIIPFVREGSHPRAIDLPEHEDTLSPLRLGSKQPWLPNRSVSHPLSHFLFNLTSCPHNSEPPKVLTAMDKMVQQIATINNLLIFINIQISQLQKSNEGSASGEGPDMA